MYAFTFCFQTVILFCVLSLSECDVILQIQQGKLSGKPSKTLLAHKEYIAYRGIPFAEPPTGSSRFTAPKRHNGWEGIYNADKRKASCIQFNHDVKKGQTFGLFGSEDCLYLDVFTPLHEGEIKRPVIVFLYNQNFRNSGNITKDYAPDFFIEEDVIIVTVSHRLSMFGFLSFDDDILPGNSGLRDVILALEWIQDNINVFGGDTEKVTLMGAQSGAALVDILINSNKATNLFSGAILQGGSSWQSMLLPNEGKSKALKLAKEINVKISSSKKLLNKLSKTSAHDLLNNEIKALPDDFFRFEQKGLLPFGPIVEHDHPEAIIVALPENRQEVIDVPMMVGFNSQDGLEAAFQYIIEPNFLTYVDRDFPVFLPVRTGFKFDPYSSEFNEVVNEIKRFYFKTGKVAISRPLEHITYLGDVLNRYPIDLSIRKYVNISSQPIYYFNFDFDGSLNENKINLLNWKTKAKMENIGGAAAGDELCYLFLCPDLKETYIILARDGAEEITVLRRMVRLWANFAKYRNPTPSDDEILNGFTWEPVAKEEKRYLQIRDELEMRVNPNAERFQFWDDFIDKYSKLSKNGVVGRIRDEL